MKRTSSQEHLLQQITSRIRQSLELPAILQTAVQEIRSFLNVDRAKIYRFEKDGSGEVIAEAIYKKRLPTLLHLRFPASDIPPDVREQFIRVRQRVIVNVETQRRIIQSLDHPQTGNTLIEQDSRYALTDPCHLQYLTTMGVQASLIIPILYNQELWGLLAVHHSEPRTFTERELQMTQLLVDQVSIAIAQSALLAQARQQAYQEATINQVSQLLHCPINVTEIRQGILEATIQALGGSGGRLYITAEPTGEPAQLYTAGQQPNHPHIEEMPLWRKLMGWRMGNSASISMPEVVESWHHYGRSLFQHDSTTVAVSEEARFYTFHDLQTRRHLKPLIGVFGATPIRAIALIPLQFHNQFVGCLSIFRNGFDTEILWAGKHNDDERNHLPRASFAAWRELKTDQAPEWTIEDIKLAKSIGLHLYMSVMQKRVESMMRYQASHDNLTNLPNRLLFDEQLSLALINTQQNDEMLGVAFLDLDRFKTINDTLGHAVGDCLLVEVADRLKSCLRTCDSLARWGGDEFTLLIPHLSSAEELASIAERILNKLSTPFHLADREFYVTASLGIAIAPYDGLDAETLLKNADTAMYQAKQQGKNNYQLFAEEMNTRALQHFILEGDLRKALLRDEFFLHYQPQIDLSTGSIVGLEALIRWQHPELGLVSPAQFIPLAEETGLINAIGDWVLQTACEQHRQWLAAGLLPVRLAVNLSAQQFHQSDLVSLILKALEHGHMNPEFLEIEITESAAMHDTAFTSATLQQLQQIGVQIAIDDFGTGYSSLNALKHFPLHILKIDKSFVQDAVHKESMQAVRE